MTASHVILTIRQLARDTLRQSLASGIFWVMLTISGVCILLCLSVRVTSDFDLPIRGGPDQPEPSFEKSEVTGTLTLAFGAVPVPVSRDKIDSVRFLQLILAGGVADSLGVLLVLIWTSGFLPGFLEPSAVSVLLAKPVSRWSLLAGKYLGVLLFVTFHASVFVLGTWLALGLATGVWEANYLLCIPILVLHFAAFYSFATLLAVWLRNAVTCVFGVLVFWILCWGMNYARHAMVTGSDLAQVSPAFRFLVEASYWLLPKPVDFGIFLYNALNAQGSFAPLPAFAAIEQRGFMLELSIFSSLAFAVVMIAMAGYEFVHADY
jgi:ABC-type transport system involved in multi-copper enzyme maturation permease subunit